MEYYKKDTKGDVLGMKCNIKNCYWNLWTPKYNRSDVDSMVCVSESMMEHFDENDEFKLTPSTNECMGYLSYLRFCGVEK